MTESRFSDLANSFHYFHLLLVYESKHASCNLGSKDYQKACKELQGREESYYFRYIVLFF